VNLAAVQTLFPGVEAPRKSYYRVIGKEFAATIDDIGPSFLNGGRFNPKHEFGVLYLSVSPACCNQERARQFPAGTGFFRPFVTARFRVDLRRCLDLTRPEFLEDLAVQRADLLMDNDYVLPQAIAREARRVGFDALIAPSAASDRCQNLVVFKDKLTPPSYCLLDTILD